MSKRALERRLSDLATFRDPEAALEQYPTPPDLAAHLVHLAGLHGDLDRPVLDLGSGTGILAIGAALAGGDVVGVEVDPAAVAVARENERAAGVDVDWVLGDAGRSPVCARGVTVVSNPPFGAQAGNRNADRAFLQTAADLAAVSYTVHNAGSRSFVESFVGDAGGEVTHAFGADFDVDRQFDFHEADRRTIEVEVFRVAWDR